MRAILFFLCFVFFFVFNPAVAQMPTGFDTKFSKPAAPNFIDGIKKNAREDDFALIRGEFVDKIDDLTFIFQDERQGQCKIVFAEGSVPLDLSKNHEYFLWTRVVKAGSDLTLQALSISAKRNHSLRR